MSMQGKSDLQKINPKIINIQLLSNFSIWNSLIDEVDIETIKQDFYRI